MSLAASLLSLLYDDELKERPQASTALTVIGVAGLSAWGIGSLIAHRLRRQVDALQVDVEPRPGGAANRKLQKWLTPCPCPRREPPYSLVRMPSRRGIANPLTAQLTAYRARRGARSCSSGRRR